MGSEHAEAGANTASAAAGHTQTAGRERVAAGATCCSAAPAAEAEDIGARGSRELALEFELAVDIIYHRARQAWLSRLHRIAMFGAVIAGSVAATDIAGAKCSAIVAAAFAALDLVADFTTSAAIHGDIARELLGVVAGLHRSGFDEASCSAADDECFRISAGEPAPYHAARDLAYNQAVTALGRDEGSKILMSRKRRWFAHLRRFEGH